MNTHREQKNGRVIMMPVYMSNHITDEMIELFLKGGEALTVNAGIMSEQVVLPYLENHFESKGIVANADGTSNQKNISSCQEHRKKQRR
jgi:hypothetical protein